MSSSMIDQTPTALSGVSLNDLLVLLKRQRTIMLLMPTLSIAIALFYLHRTVPEYTVSLTVAPVQNSTPKLSGVSGLAGLAGISLPNDGNSQFSLYRKGLTSHEAAQIMAQDSGMMRALFNKQLSADQKTWIEPLSWYTPIARIVKKIVGMPIFPWRPPGAPELQKYLTDKLKVVEDKTSPTLVISISTDDPRNGQRLLRTLHTSVNGVLRRRTLERADGYIAYLSSQLSTLTLVEHRTAIGAILLDQEKNRMLAKSNLDYAAEMFDPPTPSLRPTKPLPFLTLGLALILGCVTGLMVAFVRDGRSKSKET
jgi:Chain length determinant protein